MGEFGKLWALGGPRDFEDLQGEKWVSRNRAQDTRRRAWQETVDKTTRVDPGRVRVYIVATAFEDIVS